MPESRGEKLSRKLQQLAEYDAEKRLGTKKQSNTEWEVVEIGGRLSADHTSC